MTASDFVAGVEATRLRSGPIANLLKGERLCQQPRHAQVGRADPAAPPARASVLDRAHTSGTRL